jgi:hypothetical protein
MLPEEEKARIEIERVLRAQLAEMRQTLELALAILPRDGKIRVTKTRDVDGSVVTLALALYAKAIKTFRGIEILCEGGLGQDAISLLRVLLETTLAILFVLQRNSRFRSRMYAVHVLSKRLQVLRKWKETDGFKRKATKQLMRNVESSLHDAVQFLAQMPRLPRRHSYGPTLEPAIAQLKAALRSGQGVTAAETAAVEVLYRATRAHWSGRTIG